MSAPPSTPAGQAINDDPAALGRVLLEVVQPVPPEVPVGADVAFKVRASCAGRDLRGTVVNVVAADRLLMTGTLAEYRDGFNESATLGAKAPEQVGEVTWTLLFPRQEIDGVAYAESALPVSFRTRPHRTSLAVWAVPSLVPTGERFWITVGAKSSGACDLTGAKVTIQDQNGAEVGSGTLGDTPWPDTSALYWARIELAAPAKNATLVWNAVFAAPELTLPHAGASTGFSFATVKRPEHRLTVKVVDDETAAPLDDVEVALGPYRATTDAAGLARLDMPAGQFALAAWKSGFDAPPMAVEIAEDTLLEVALKRLPEEITVWG